MCEFCREAIVVLAAAAPVAVVGARLLASKIRRTNPAVAAPRAISDQSAGGPR